MILKILARPIGIEPTTFGSGGQMFHVEHSTHQAFAACQRQTCQRESSIVTDPRPTIEAFQTIYPWVFWVLYVVPAACRLIVRGGH